ncbi:hypothetical protein RBG61_11755 [Paludicola sp. MB14-C6]|uniref:hypothetical protein n=1 Tax=Paludihabitans sp. MB14-C6 TaxID=3070656 RepID=UPI0027DC0E61|nr:hypothetical protein [Paludicola sp. MB14-C6]WMJ22657.1 hypothetical protein RBG61_11755 [Paludicola sp. MB14-C6]
MKTDEEEDLSEILDKMLELQKSEKSNTFIHKTIVVLCGIAAIIIIVFLCLMMYKNNFSIESLLSLLLAFFSIFISMFFYFKASDTSNAFYDKSYDIMKDVSVTLGKIEAQFGEKLNNLNDKISHISYKESETTEKLESTEDEKQKIIDELFEKTQMNDKEKEAYRRRLQEKEKETENLQNQLLRLQRERNMLVHNDSYLLNKNNRVDISKLFKKIPYMDLLAIAEGRIGAISMESMRIMSDMGINPAYLLNNEKFRSLFKEMMDDLRLVNENM